MLANSYRILHDTVLSHSVPSPPMVDLIPIYFYDSMDLVGLKTIFFDVVSKNSVLITASEYYYDYYDDSD